MRIAIYMDIYVIVIVSKYVDFLGPIKDSEHVLSTSFLSALLCSPFLFGEVLQRRNIHCP